VPSENLGHSVMIDVFDTLGQLAFDDFPCPLSSRFSLFANQLLVLKRQCAGRRVHFRAPAALGFAVAHLAEMASRNSSYPETVIRLREAIRRFGTEPVRTAYRSPRQLWGGRVLRTDRPPYWPPASS